LYDDPLAAPLWSIAFAHRANAVLSERRPDEKVRRGPRISERRKSRATFFPPDHERFVVHLRHTSRRATPRKIARGR